MNGNKLLFSNNVHNPPFQQLSYNQLGTKNVKIHYLKAEY